MQMIFHSRAIALVLLVDMVALLMYNFSGMCVTGQLACHHHPVAESAVMRVPAMQPKNGKSQFKLETMGLQ